MAHPARGAGGIGLPPLSPLRIPSGACGVAASATRVMGRPFSMATRRVPVAGYILADRYELRGVIGTGGMATVHRAWDMRLGREVAVKLLIPSLASDPVVRLRFEAEANA